MDGWLQLLYRRLSMQKTLTIIADVSLEDDFQEEFVDYILASIKSYLEMQFSDVDGDRDCKIVKLELK